MMTLPAVPESDWTDWPSVGRTDCPREVHFLGSTMAVVPDRMWHHPQGLRDRKEQKWVKLKRLLLSSGGQSIGSVHPSSDPRPHDCYSRGQRFIVVAPLNRHYFSKWLLLFYFLNFMSLFILQCCCLWQWWCHLTSSANQTPPLSLCKPNNWC